MSIGYYYDPKDEAFFKYLYAGGVPDVASTENLFASHPAVVIRNHDIAPYKSDSRNYYLFHCELPHGKTYDIDYGYEEIRDAMHGSWHPTNISTFKQRDEEFGNKEFEVQRFRYIPTDATSSSWRMTLYGMAGTAMKLLKVYETEDAATSQAVRLHTEAEKALQECRNDVASQAYKVRQLAAALDAERTILRRLRASLLQQSRLVSMRLRERAMAERLEADSIAPPRWRRWGRRGRRRGI